MHSKRILRTRWNNYPPTQQKRSYGAKNRLKRNVSMFCSITHLKYNPIFRLSRTHVYTNPSINNSVLFEFFVFDFFLSRFCGSESRIQKNNFQKFFLSQNLKFLISVFREISERTVLTIQFGFRTIPPSVYCFLLFSYLCTRFYLGCKIGNEFEQ